MIDTIETKPYQHKSPVTAVDVSRDSYVSGSYDGSVISWTNQCEALWRFSARDLINDVRYSPDELYVAVACADKRAYILRADTGLTIWMSDEHLDDVNAVAWSPDGNSVLTVTDALGVDAVLWNWRLSSRPEMKLAGHTHGVFSIDLSPSGKLIATSGEDATVRVWSISGELIHTLHHPGDPETVCWIDDRFLASGCEDGMVRVWDSVSGAESISLQISPAAVRLVRMSKDMSLIIVGVYDGTIRLVDVKQLTTVEIVRGENQWERAAALRHDGLLVTGSFGDRPVVRQRGVMLSKARPTYGINRLISNSSLLLACLDSGDVVEVRSGAKVATHSSIVNGGCLVNTKLKNTVFTGDYLGEIAKSVRLAGDNDHWVTVSRRPFQGGPINAISEARDDGCVVACNYSGDLMRVSYELEEIARFSAHPGPIKDVVVVDNRIYTAGADGTLRCHQLDGTHVFTAQDRRIVLINSLDIALHEGLIVTGSREGRVALWSSSDGTLVDILPDIHTKSVKSVQISDDGKVVISSSYDACSYLYERVEGRWGTRPFIFHRKPGVPTSVLDGDQIHLGGWDGRITSWTTSGFLLHSVDAASLIMQNG